MKSVLAVLLATALLAAPVAAQSVIGRALVEGKVALLYDNGTWAYESPSDPSAPKPCDTITPRVQFCGQSLGWATTAISAPEINAAYRIDARHYAQYIIEDIGTADGITLEFMRGVVVDNAEMATGTPVEVVDVQPASMSGLAGDTVTYRVKFNGLDVIFSTSVFVEPKLTLQVMTYAIGSEFTPEHAALHADFLANTKLNP